MNIEYFKREILDNRVMNYRKMRLVKDKMEYAEVKIRNMNEVYSGKFRRYMDEYLKKFVADDFEYASKPENKDMEEQVKKELKDEAMYIECFCKWLDEDRGINPVERCKKKIGKKN